MQGGSSQRRGHREKKEFLHRLFRLLELNRLESITWTNRGDAFCIARDNFMNRDSQRFFHGIHYHSFTRRLKRYGFRRTTRKNCSHEQLFQQEGFERGSLRCISPMDNEFFIYESPEELAAAARGTYFSGASGENIVLRQGPAPERGDILEEAKDHRPVFGAGPPDIQEALQNLSLSSVRPVAIAPLSRHVSNLVRNEGGITLHRTLQSGMRNAGQVQYPELRVSSLEEQERDIAEDLEALPRLLSSSFERTGIVNQASFLGPSNGTVGGYLDRLQQYQRPQQEVVVAPVPARLPLLVTSQQEHHYAASTAQQVQVMDRPDRVMNQNRSLLTLQIQRILEAQSHQQQRLHRHNEQAHEVPHVHLSGLLQLQRVQSEPHRREGSQQQHLMASNHHLLLQNQMTLSGDRHTNNAISSIFPTTLPALLTEDQQLALALRQHLAEQQEGRPNQRSHAFSPWPPNR